MPTTTSTSSSGSAPATVPVAEQLRFTAKTVDDQSFSRKSLAGKAVVLWFWAPWCPKFRAEAGRVVATTQPNTGKVILAESPPRTSCQAIKKFVTDYKVGGFQHVADLDASIWTQFGVTQQPAYAFISPDGKVDVVKQQLSESALTERVGALVKA
ncbi:redoxin domain-containing protein [Kibdelosporangium aridum]|nr:redoxin domain-containing protein [Kibdelosporangium aridum]